MSITNISDTSELFRIRQFLIGFHLEVAAFTPGRGGGFPSRPAPFFGSLARSSGVRLGRCLKQVWRLWEIAPQLVVCNPKPSPIMCSPIQTRLWSMLCFAIAPCFPPNSATLERISMDKSAYCFQQVTYIWTLMLYLNTYAHNMWESDLVMWTSP